MNGNRIFIVLTLLFASVVCLSAQVRKKTNAMKKEPSNTVRIDKFLRKENFDKFQFLVSTREDIKKLLGKDCADGNCIYDDDWTMRFVYLSNLSETQTIRPNVPGNQISLPEPRPEFEGKLSGIFFSPRKRSFLPDDFVFPAEFKCIEGSSLDFSCPGDGVVVKYNYKKIDGSRGFKREIVSIFVGITKAERGTVIVEPGTKDTKDKVDKP